MSETKTKQLAYLPRKEHVALHCLIFLIFAGLFHPVAVREMRAGIECRNEDQYLTAENGDVIVTEKGEHIILEQGQQQCELEIAHSIFPLPSWIEVKHVLSDELLILKNIL